MEFKPVFNYLHFTIAFSEVQIMLHSLTLAAENLNTNIKRFPKVYAENNLLNAPFNNWLHSDAT